MTTQIYFAQTGVGGPIKIGITVYPPKRIGELQTGCPWPITLLGVRAGEPHHENWLHKRFSKSRMTGEWFECSEELLSFIATVLHSDFQWPEILRKPERVIESNKLAEAFLSEIETFLNLDGMSATAFGRAVASDPNLVSDLRAGRMPNLRLVKKVHDFIDAAQRPAVRARKTARAS